MNVKAPPLLSPPTQNERWWQLTENDRGMISGEIIRVRSNSEGLAKKLYYGMELEIGYGQPPTEHDEKMILKDLDQARRLNFPETMAKCYYYLKKNNFEVTVSSEDEKTLSTAETVGSTDETLRPKFLMYLKGIGLIKNIRPRDEKIVREQLGLARKTKSGRNIAELHHIMAEIGLEADLTDTDIDAIKKSVERGRSGKINSSYAELMFHVSKIMKDIDKPEGNPPLPPLKES